MIRLVISLLFTLTIVTTNYSQIKQPDRFEQVLNKDENGFELITCDKKGLLLWRVQRLLNQPDSSILQLVKLDTSFQIGWQKLFVQSNQLEFITQKHHQNNVFFLFRNNASKTRNFELIQINTSNGNVIEHSIKNIIPMVFFDLEINSNAVVIGGYYNYRPLVVLYNLREKIPRVLPGIFNDKSELIQLKVNDDQTIDVVLKGKNREKISTLYISTFTQEAQHIKTIELKTEKNKALLFGRSSQLNGLSQLVAGVYGRTNSNYSRGIFVGNINEYGEQFLKYYNYAEFDNFFSYMRANREARVKRRIERKKIKNKKIKLNYRLLVHEIISNDGQYVLLGEAFYPKYKIIQGAGELHNSVSYVNNGIFSYNRVFEGYQYTHAVVIGFDKLGNVLWDNSFEINGIITLNLQQFVHADVSNENVNLLYVYDDKIRTKVIKENDVLEGKKAFDLKLQYASDIELENETEIHGLVNWYDDVFVAYGIQAVKNLERSQVELKREVFFINKVVPN